MKINSLKRLAHYFFYLQKKDYCKAMDWRDSKKEQILSRMVKEGWYPDDESQDLVDWYKSFGWILNCECMDYDYENDTYSILTPLGWIEYKRDDYYNIIGNSFDYYYLNQHYYYTSTADDEISNILWKMESKGLLHNHIDGYDGYTKTFSVVSNCNKLQLARYIRQLKRVIQKNHLKVTNEKIFKNVWLVTIETYESYWGIYY